MCFEQPRHKWLFETHVASRDEGGSCNSLQNLCHDLVSSSMAFNYDKGTNLWHKSVTYDRISGCAR